jgi:hypothetical protein
MPLKRNSAPTARTIHTNHPITSRYTAKVSPPNNKPPSPSGNNENVIRLLETNRKKYSDLMQKLEDADTRLMVNKERYSEVKESLAGALKNLEVENI